MVKIKKITTLIQKWHNKSEFVINLNKGHNISFILLCSFFLVYFKSNENSVLLDFFSNSRINQEFFTATYG